MGGISGEVLMRLGAKSPYILAGQWWRLVTAMFLHAGLLHIGMNMWCLVDLGPEVESLFSTTKFTVLYLVTGVAGFVLSLWWSPFGMSVGASGAIMGLIGILIGASFHHGHLGKEYRSQLWRWVIYIAIFGIFFNVDNAAHFGGLASGFVLGYLVPEGEPATRPSENLWNALAVLSVLVIAASFVLMTLQLRLSKVTSDKRRRCVARNHAFVGPRLASWQGKAADLENRSRYSSYMRRPRGQTKGNAATSAATPEAKVSLAPGSENSRRT